jgi:hypothetical protein
MPSISCTDAVYQIRRAQAKSESPFTFDRSFFNWGSDRLFLALTWPPLKFAAGDGRQAADLLAFLLQLQGYVGSFYCGILNPDEKYKGSLNTAVTVNEVVSPRKIKANFSQTGTGLLKAGNFFSISTGELKIITADVTVSGATADIEFAPAIRKTPGAGTQLNYQTPKGIFRLEEPDTEWSINKLRHYGLSLSAREID